MTGPLSSTPPPTFTRKAPRGQRSSRKQSRKGNYYNEKKWTSSKRKGKSSKEKVMEESNTESCLQKSTATQAENSLAEAKIENDKRCELSPEQREYKRIETHKSIRISKELKGVPRGLILKQESYGPQSLRDVDIKKLGKISNYYATTFNAAHQSRKSRFKRKSMKEGKGKGKKNHWKLPAALCMNDKHMLSCFNEMLDKEKLLCGEYAVLYHSYSHAGILYEIHAALANVLFGYEWNSPIPRLLLDPFRKVPDAKVLKDNHAKLWRTDHHMDFRNAAICGTSALLAPDQEAPPARVWKMGYHVGRIDGLFDQLLKHATIPHLKEKIHALCDKYNVRIQGHRTQNAQKFAGNPNVGKLLQIFVRRDIINDVAYGALPMGHACKLRPDLAKVLDGNNKIIGQVRICCNPRYFLKPELIKIFTYAADKHFHEKREGFQEEIRKLIRQALNTEEKKEAAIAKLGSKLSPLYPIVHCHPIPSPKKSDAILEVLVFGLVFGGVVSVTEVLCYLSGFYSPTRYFLLPYIILPTLKATYKIPYHGARYFFMFLGFVWKAVFFMCKSLVSYTFWLNCYNSVRITLAEPTKTMLAAKDTVVPLLINAQNIAVPLARKTFDCGSSLVLFGAQVGTRAALEAMKFMGSCLWDFGILAWKSM